MKARAVSALLLAAGLSAACGRSTRPNPGTDSPSMAGMANGAGGASCAGSDCEPLPASTHGVVPMHRLRNTEYQNSVYDLLGVAAVSPAADASKPYEAAIDDARPWFGAVSELAAELFELAGLGDPLTCVGDEVERACALAVIDELGRRAFRRPLLEGEKQAFVALFDQLAPSEGSRVALEDVVRALLLSPAFLFHVELSEQPDGTAPEPLDSYALAARLSFALWGTTPDPQLLDAAAAGLTEDGALSAAYERLVADQQVLGLTDGWGEVWLGWQALASHEVDLEVFPGFSDSLHEDMQAEQRELLRQYWLQPIPVRALPVLDLSFVTPALAAHYGYGAGAEGFVENTADARAGLLGQGAFLLQTSLPRRVSASHRGNFVVERLLCRPVPAPPPGGSEPFAPDFPAGMSERQTLEQLVAEPGCHACHQQFDPIGLALAEYDAVGAHRSQDSQGQPIDTTVQLSAELFPGTSSVTGALELGRALGKSPLFSSCVAQQLASYMIHRAVTEETDADLIRPLSERIAEGGRLSELSRSIVMSDHFRYRRLAVVP